MSRFAIPLILASLLSTGGNQPPAAAQEAEKETKYLAFQIFTNFTTDSRDAQTLNNGMKEPLLPGTVALRNYVLDIKQRIGTVGDTKARLAVMLGPLCFDQSDAETAKYIELAFDLALETDLALGFHIDDSMFWRSRKDLWNDPKNVEALDWDGTPCKSRRLDWSKEPSEAPPQMCFNSKVIQQEVQKRSGLIGKAIQDGVKKLQDRKKPELFAGVILGWETMIGQDFKTGKYLGYRALINRGFSRERPPKDMDGEREKVVQEFIELWTTGIADTGVSPRQIYSHTAFLSRRAFKGGDSKDITYMKNDKGNTYSQHNHFAPPSVAFGKSHRPGFSTYPQPGLFEDIYELVDKHKQVGWASCEGTNMQPGTGPGQTGMNMETYLAKMFNHGATLTNVFSWGIGGEAMKNMNYRLCTENEEALQAYRKFLKGETLVEGKVVAGLQERLPPKIQKIQKELPAWLQKTGNKEAAALMQKMQGQIKAKKWEEVEETVDSILKLMGEKPKDGKQGAGAAHLRFFGYAGVDSGLRDPHVGGDKTNYLDEVADFCNIAGLNVYDPAESAAARLDAMSKEGVSAGLDVQAIFFERVNPLVKKTGSKTEYRLRADYKARWDQFRRTSVLDARLASIACFYIADEPVWNGITAKDLATQADLIKATYPSVPLLVIEAPPSINDLVVPKSVDWIGFDRFGTVDPGSDKRYLQNLRDLKDRRTTSEQKIVIVFEAQWMPDYGKAGYEKEAMAELADRYYRLASSDPDVIGMVGFSWPGGLGGPDRYGARNLPESVKAEHRRIGLTITGKPASPGK